MKQWSDEELLTLAMKARERAYAPYSQFQVGCAIVDQNGIIHLGCNVENAAYAPSNCAERTALFRAIADGVKPGSFVRMAIVADSMEPITPCGVCRQVMAELCSPELVIVMGNMSGQYELTTVAQLLPGAFGAQFLKEVQDGSENP